MLEIAFVTLAVLVVLLGVCAFAFTRSGRSDYEDYYGNYSETEGAEKEIAAGKQKKDAVKKKSGEAPLENRRIKHSDPSESKKSGDGVVRKDAPPEEKPQAKAETQPSQKDMPKQQAKSAENKPTEEKAAIPEATAEDKFKTRVVTKAEMEQIRSASLAESAEKADKTDKTDKTEANPPLKEAKPSAARYGRYDDRAAAAVETEAEEVGEAEEKEGGVNLVPIVAVCAAVLVLLAAAAFVLIRNDAKRHEAENVSQPETMTALVENIRQETELNGEFKCENPSVRYFTASGKVTGLNVKEGDRVKKGQTIYELDSSSIKERMDILEERLKNATVTEEKEVEKSESLKAASAGTVRIRVAVGDEVDSGETVAVISGLSDCRVSLEFEGEEEGLISDGDAASVSSGGKTYEGKVSSVSENKIENGDGGVLIIYKAEVSFSGGSSGESASVSVNGLKANGSVKASGGDETSVKAQVSGKITAVSVRDGAQVDEGDAIATVAYTEKVSETKTDELEAKDIKIQLEQLETELKNYTVTADADGYVKKLYVKKDENAAINSQAVVIIPDNSFCLTFSIDREHAENMTVPTAVSYSIVKSSDADIPASAWEKVDTDKKYSCVLEDIEPDEENEDSYICRVVPEDQSGLYDGMKAEVKVVTYSAYDALLVPEKYVKDGKVSVWRGSKAEEVKVETGIITDDGYVEITKGLNSMDKIITGEEKSGEED